MGVLGLNFMKCSAGGDELHRTGSYFWRQLRRDRSCRRGTTRPVPPVKPQLVACASASRRCRAGRSAPIACCNSAAECERESSFTDFLRAMWQPRQYDNIGNGTTAADPVRQPARVVHQSLHISPARRRLPRTWSTPAKIPRTRAITGSATPRCPSGCTRLRQRFDLTLEASEWQNLWYTNGAYGDGLTENRRVLGHWGADQRVFGDDLGARTMARLGWEPGFGGLLQFRARRRK